MIVETWPDYVRRVTSGLNQSEVARKTGNQVSQANVGRWLRGELTTPSASSVVAFARAFNRSPIEALVAAGYLQPSDMAVQARPPLTEYSTDELFIELQSRYRES